MELNLHDSYRLKCSDTVDIYTNEQILTNIHLELAPVLPLQLSGYVLDHFTDGSGIEGAAVLVYSTENEFIQKTFTDEAGYFLFTKLPAGQYKLTAGKQGYRTAPFSPVILDEDRAMLHNVILPPLETPESLIYGRVTTLEGAPLESARVNVMSRDGGTTASTLTSATGEYAVYGLGEGDYTLVISAPEYGNRRFDVTISGETMLQSINAVLSLASAPEGEAAISGFITDGQGSPIASAWVGLYAVSSEFGEELIAATTTTDDGFYVFSPLQPGQYVVKSKSMTG